MFASRHQVAAISHTASTMLPQPGRGGRVRRDRGSARGSARPDVHQGLRLTLPTARVQVQTAWKINIVVRFTCLGVGSVTWSYLFRQENR